MKGCGTHVAAGRYTGLDEDELVDVKARERDQ